VAFTPDSRFVLTGGTDNVAMFWDVVSARRILQLKGHTGAVNAVAISPDGVLAATAANDGHAILWDLFSGRKVQDFSLGDVSVTAIAYSPDGRQILTGSGDGSARLWDIAGGHVAVHLIGHAKPLVPASSWRTGKGWSLPLLTVSVNFWDRSNGTLLVTFHHVAGGFLWTTPADEAAPSGWFWTDRPELLSVLRSGLEGEPPAALSHEDPACSAYLDTGCITAGT